MSTDEKSSAQRWEELKTPAAVMAAFEAGRRVEFTASSEDRLQDDFEVSGWIVIPPQDREVVADDIARRWRYRALIEDAPPIPAGFTPWAGGECPAEARENRTRVILRNGFDNVLDCGCIFLWGHEGTDCDIIAYRVEPEQAQQSIEDAQPISVESIKQQRDRLWMLLDDIDTQDDASKGDDAHFRRCTRKIQQKRHAICTPDGSPAIDFNARPIPVESLGRADDGVEALAVELADVWTDSRGRKSYEFDSHGLAEFARRLRPQVDASTAERRARELLAAEYDRDGISFVADCIRTDAVLSGPETRAIRALTAALNPENGHD